MSKDKRVIGLRNIPLAFTCENHSYKTNIKRGFGHGKYARSRGSVLRKPLIVISGSSLWLEHIVDKKWKSKDQYWLMCYNKKGYPIIPLSAVFSKKELAEMTTELKKYVS